MSEEQERVPSLPCPNCERCTWNPGPDCGEAEHPHCSRCGHCCGRHVPHSQAVPVTGQGAADEDAKRLAAELDGIAWELRTFDKVFVPFWLGVLAALLLTLWIAAH